MPKFDIAQAQVDTRIVNKLNPIERMEHSSVWGIRRWDNKKDHKEALRADARGEVLGKDYFQYSEKEALDIFGMPQLTRINGNLLLNEGIDEMWTLVAGTGGTAFTNANAYLGVGDSNTAAAASQTGLQASTNKLYKAMDTSYPTYGTSQYATWRSTFESADGNFAWNEYTVANGNSDSADNMNRKVDAQGTKQSGQTWELTLQITLS